MTVGDTTGRAPGQVPVRGPTASTVRFALLVAAVVATSSYVFLLMYLLLPGRAETLSRSLDTCQAALDADPASTADLVTQADVERLHAATGRWRDCLRPVFADQLVAIGAGFGVLTAVAGGLYLAHPYWTVRRRRLRPLAGAAPPGFIADLDGLSARMGLARPPHWMLAPRRGTIGGQAFGLPRRRLVQLDAGLVLQHVTDRAAFRAVVLHELAHIRNRDVDKTYLTMSVWRSFLAVVVLPFLVLTLHPQLLSRPLRWAPPSIASPSILIALVVLTALVYLIRNAVLRVREVEADAWAHAVDGPDSALPAVLSRLPPPTTRLPPWLDRLGTHPEPEHRLAAVLDRGGGPSIGLWELTGTGVTAGVIVAQLFMVGFLAGLWSVLGAATVALLVGPPVMLVLTLVCWRADATRPTRRPSARRWLGGPLVLAAGIVAGTLLAAPGLARVPQQSPGSWLAAGIVLAAALVPLAAWVASMAGGVLADPAGARPRRALLAVTAAAALAGTTALTVWLPFALRPYGFAVIWGLPPATGAAIEWYERLAVVTGAAPGGATRLLVLHPLVLPALAALWVVPILVGPRGLMPLRRAVIPALLGAAFAVAASVGLPLALRSALPATVRRDPPEDTPGAPFFAVLDNTTVAIGAFAVAAVVAAVAARRGPYRPALAALAALLTTLLATAGMFLVAVPVQCMTNIWDVQPPPTNCLPAQQLATLSWYLLWTLVQGLILAVPLAGLATVAGALTRRGHPSGTYPRGGSSTTARWRRVLTAALLTVLVAALTVLVWGILPAAQAAWLTPQLR